MKGKRYTEEFIISVIKEYKSGVPVKEICRKHGISDASFYKWKAKFDGMEVSDAKKLRALEEENRRLKRVVADLTLDNVMLKDLNSKKW